MCIVCDKLASGIVEAKAKARAAKTAHVLAVKEAEKALKKNRDFSFVDLYTIYFRKIYEHEYLRNQYVESERITYFESVNPKNRGSICDYHCEFEDEFKKKVYKVVELNYARSKWPNTLER